jgi:hypothetical protein
MPSKLNAPVDADFATKRDWQTDTTLFSPFLRGMPATDLKLMLHYRFDCR